MKNINKIILKILSVVILIGLLLPCTSVTANEVKSVKGEDIGDITVLSQNVVTTYQGKDKIGNDIYTATIGDLKYLADLETVIDCAWYYNSDKAEWYIKDNLYTATVKDGVVTVNYYEESYSWKPLLSIGDKELKVPIVTRLNGITGYVDPINENYIGNTLYWKYENGITRCLRAIEGMLIEYYTVDSMPDGDIIINNNENKSAGWQYSRPVYAYDAENNDITVTTDSKVADTVITLDSLKDAIFPITIDPDSNFIASSADGYAKRRYSAYDVGETWSDLYSLSGTHSTSTSEIIELHIGTAVPSNKWLELSRAALFFDTSSLGTSTVISAASVKLYGNYKSSVWYASSTSINLYSFTPDTANTLTEGDYNYAQWGTTAYSSAITYNSFSTTGYNTFNLNATGLAAISKTGYTNIGIRLNWDATNTAPTWNYDAFVTIRINSYEKGAGYRPILTVTYTASEAPTVNDVAASLIAKTTARLNGYVITTGGMDCDVRWGWGTTTQETITAYDDYTTYAGTYEVGAAESVYYDVTGLTADTTYYFRFQVYNGTYSAISDELTFATESSISDPTNFRAYPTATTISLTWTLGDGSSSALIRVASGAYPDSTSAGTSVYSGSATSYLYEGLTAGTTYYFSIWGKSGDDYSTGYDTAVVTTNAFNIAGDDFESPDTIDSWTQDPDSSSLTNLEPFYTMMNNFYDSTGIPVDNLWLIFGMIISVLLGIAAFVVTKAPLAAVIMLCAGLLFCVVIGIMPSWIIFVLGIFVVGTLVFHKGAAA